ncbi:MFS general substrate transporter [Mollisia scopiformis]|uniref:MFS general substrate transporter n=1 Tax=Mollisia scopiformis TaxID=149040 RepID=A0A194X2J8_MOLSC|nr:MFS general substrate transporter [Mollisia scopiformis]KUJ14234.1 MFS general substrate transporter [Mollisia scopiformis]
MSDTIESAARGEEEVVHREFWGAKDSLRRNAGLHKRASDEVTPLLADGQGNDGDNSRRGREWEGHADYEGLTWWHKPSMYWLLPPFFLFAIAGGGIMVPKLNLILSLVCRGYFIDRSSMDPNFVLAPIMLGGDNPQCRIPEVQALATKFTLYITMISGTLSAIMSPKLGALSDRYGRLRILVITSGGAFLGEIITIAAATYPDSMSYNWLLLGAFCDGLCGSFNAGMAITHAYAADCTPPPKRAVAFGYFHACLFSGIAIGPLIAAFLVKETGSLISTFYFALAVHTFFILFVLTMVPESLTKKRQHQAQERHNAELYALGLVERDWVVFFKRANILAPLKILYPTGPGTTAKLRSNLILLSMVDTIIFGVAMGAMTVVVYYLGFQFGWDTAQISIFTSVVNVVRVTALIVVLPTLNYLVRTRRANKQRRESGFAVPEPNSGTDTLDLSIIRAAVCFEIVGYGTYAAVRTGPLFVVAGVMAAMGGIGSPTLQSALTKHVPHDRIGQLLGATGLLHALARIVCPLIFNLIYANTVGTFPQAVFVVLSCCFVVGFIASWGIRPNVYLEDPITFSGNTRTDADPDVLVDEEVTGL